MSLWLVLNSLIFYVLFVVLEILISTTTGQPCLMYFIRVFHILYPICEGYDLGPDMVLSLLPYLPLVLISSSLSYILFPCACIFWFFACDALIFVFSVWSVLPIALFSLFLTTPLLFCLLLEYTKMDLFQNHLLVKSQNLFPLSNCSHRSIFQVHRRSVFYTGVVIICVCHYRFILEHT